MTESQPQKLIDDDPFFTPNVLPLTEFSTPQFEHYHVALAAGEQTTVRFGKIPEQVGVYMVAGDTDEHAYVTPGGRHEADIAFDIGQRGRVVYPNWSEEVTVQNPSGSEIMVLVVGLTAVQFEYVYTS